jgi:hypothetical protein
MVVREFSQFALRIKLFYFGAVYNAVLGRLK